MMGAGANQKLTLRPNTRCWVKRRRWEAPGFRPQTRQGLATNLTWSLFLIRRGPATPTHPCRHRARPFDRARPRAPCPAPFLVLLLRRRCGRPWAEAKGIYRRSPGSSPLCNCRLRGPPVAIGMHSHSRGHRPQSGRSWRQGWAARPVPTPRGPPDSVLYVLMTEINCPNSSLGNQ